MKFLGTATVILAVSAALAGCGAANTTTTGSTNGSQTNMPKSDSPDKVTAIVDEGTKQQTSTMMVKYGILTGTGNEKSEGNVEIKDGKVMLTNFKTAKGPDLHIYLTKGKDVQTGKKLGKIDVDKSEQTFDLAGANLDDYDSVIVYCDKAHVTFGAADLTDNKMDNMPVSSAMGEKEGILTGNGNEKSEGNVQIKDGKVMLTNFKTAKGPDLHIYLTKGKDVQTGKKLGKIDVDKSEQTFDLGDANLSDYDSVIIYCDKAHVTFGAADLKDKQMDAKKGVLTGTGNEKSEGDVEIKDGKVMLTNFKTTKGPDLHIYLTKGKDVQTGKKLGKIDVDKSEQTFDLNGADLSEYNSVVIYCDKAHVIFGAADIS
ncbi:DM13 domain-containing protein [Paenibacillus melissococcoides]|uniref:DM13 domain-containing protein n=2 Tax=Paenibacillus melissococcoides TaxID=2912268 RepID=A0ABM9FWB3_9BACL|nr:MULTISPECIES: DM13 domain-containing protein [Paenibacillus]MEB9896038.1 DM13 domain-containing protein [Bacillus cereus]GIO76500.1 hypothetical protein J6TS7_01100 [Paenibacillus dendritiformis]CAH8243448.1 DM13 domain-containing protein [Paenibacillus melissococcoides]CAH8707815.1 DM13 domain-containing protein [Paenibacillus melissococcoides]